MIHLYALVLGALLTASAALGGHILSAVLLVYIVLLRKPQARVPPLVLGIIVSFSALQILSTLVINIIVRYSPTAREKVFGSAFRLLVESVGIYDFSASAGVAAGACVPSALLLLFVALTWRWLSRPSRSRRVRSLWTSIAWALLSIAAALIAPTVLAVVPLLLGMAGIASVAFGADSLFVRVPGDSGLCRARVPFLILYVSVLCGTTLGCLIIAAMCTAQNPFVANVLRGVDAMYGLARIYDLPTDIAVCRVLQVCALTIALFLAQMTLVCFNEYRRDQQDRVNTQFPLRGYTVPRRRQRLSARESFSSSNRIAARFCERVVSLSWSIGQCFMRVVWSSSRLLPLVCMAAHMIAFPSLTSLSLLPSLMAGQLMRRARFCGLLRLSLALSGTMIVAQYIVLATKRAMPLLVRRLFFSDVGIEWAEFLQVVCSEVIFLVMIAAVAAVHSYPRVDRHEDETADEEYNEKFERSHSIGQAPYMHGSHRVITNTTNNNDNNNNSDGGNNQNDGRSHRKSHNTIEQHAVQLTALDDTAMYAERVLGAQRVAELLRLVSRDLDEDGQHERLFSRLVGRPPTSVEDRHLAKHVIPEALLRDKVCSAEELVVVHYVRWIGVLFMRNAVLTALFLLFLVGTFTYQMDFLHLIVLVLFGVYFFIPGVVDDKWLPVIIYVMLLTAFELVFTFTSQFFTLPVYIPGTPVQWATIGFVPLRARYESIPYFVAVFGLSLLYLKGRSCRSWGKVVSHYEWDRFTGFVSVRQWSMRLTMTVATTVFIALGLFLSRSLIVEGFFGLFLILSIVSVFLGLSGRLLRVLWFIACVYSGIVVLVTTLCQFAQVEELVRRVAESIPGCAGTTRCQNEIGLYPTERNMLLTVFLAPWFLAFATTATHLAASGAGECNACKETIRNGNRNISRDGYTMGDALSARVPYGDAHRNHEDDINNKNNSSNSSSSGTDDNNNDNNNTATTTTTTTTSDKNITQKRCGSCGMRFGRKWNISAQSYSSNDQRFLRHVTLFLAALDRMGGWLASFGADYGCVVVWLALLFAAMHPLTLLNALYIAFFLLDLTHITVLMYCVLHILLLYMYAFSFIPELQYTVRGVPLGALVGLTKDSNAVPFNQVIGPVLVFFAVLLRIHTQGANKAARRRQRTEGPESIHWRSVLCTQLFYYAGFEAFALTLLITVAVGGMDVSSSAICIALMIALLAQRPRFHYAWISFFLLLITGAVLAWEYLLRLNNTHHLFPGFIDAIARESDVWRQWVFTHRASTATGAFFGVMLLHTNRQQARDTAVSFAVLRSQFEGHTSLIGQVRSAKVSLLQRLSREKFDSVVPRVVETSPRSFLGRITTGIIFTMSYTYPIPILTFSTGVASSPCLINLLLILGGLLHLVCFEAMQWKFFRLWPIVEKLYYLLVCLPLLCGTPFVRQFLLQHLKLSEVLGLVKDGHTYSLTPWHVVLLFFVGVQTRVYHDFRYEKILRRLYHATAVQHSRHEALCAYLIATYVQEKKVAEEHNRVLHQKLNEIRQTSHIVEDTLLPTNIPPVRHTSYSKTEASVPHAMQSNVKERAVGEAAGKGQSGRALPHGDDHREGYWKGFAERNVSQELTPLRKKREGRRSHPKSTDDAAPSGGCSRLARRVYNAINKGALRLCDWMALHTYEPGKHKKTKHRKLCTRLFLSFIHLLKWHTDFIALIATMINFILTQTLWEMLPFLFILLVANTYNPFPPRILYRLLSIYIVVGIVIKATIGVVFAQVKPTNEILNILSWIILHVEHCKYDTRYIGYSYIMTDFIVYAVIAVHTEICLANGVYTRKDSLCSREPEDATTPTEEHSLSVENKNETVVRVVESASSPSVSDGALHSQPDTPIQTPIGENSQVLENKVREATALDKIHNTSMPPEGFCAADLEDEQQDRVDERRCVEGDRVIDSEKSLSMDYKHFHGWRDFLRNATTITGVGRDWYIYSITIEGIALLVFVFGYNEMSGGLDVTLQEGLQRNLLPGPMVLIVFCTIIILIIDRMLYVTQCMLGKFILNTLSGFTYCLCYLVWGNLAKVRSRAVGNTFFVLKVLALAISVLQLRVGYPLHRRHDPFTTIKNPSTLRQICYLIYRAIPFLWELRTITDWTVERTALSLGKYFKVEDIIDIVYGRRMEIISTKVEQPVFGTPIRRFAKVKNGFLYVGIIVLVLVVPLAYYSTFNPSMIVNDVTQLKDSLSMVSLRFYSSATYRSTPLPSGWRVWLTRTRPTLTSLGFGTTKPLQLITLDSCSNELWPISPQAFRRLKRQLTDVAAGNATMDMFNTLEVSRRAGGESSPRHTRSWNIPPATARELMELMNTTVVNESHFVLLKNFYSPFVFNRAKEIEMYFSAENANTMDCSVQLRREDDVILQTTVRYWCLKCQSLFTSGNIPFDNLALYPEWECLSQGVGCSGYNFEMRNRSADAYNSVPMYFVVLSDPIAGGVPFLQGFGIIALYTTFVLAIGRFFRAMFSDHAKNVILYDMADPTPVGQLLEYIAIARECGELRLEQSVYFELIDLLRSPEKLLRLTGFNERMYDTDNQP